MSSRVDSVLNFFRQDKVSNVTGGSINVTPYLKGWVILLSWMLNKGSHPDQTHFRIHEVSRLQ